VQINDDNDDDEWFRSDQYVLIYKLLKSWIENSWLQVLKFVRIHEFYEIFKIVKIRKNSLNYWQDSQCWL